MSRPQFAPEPHHFTGQSDSYQLPYGWTSEFDVQHNLMYYIDIRDAAHPHSQWTRPESGGNREQFNPNNQNNSYNPQYQQQPQQQQQYQQQPQQYQQQQQQQQQKPEHHLLHDLEFGAGGMAVGAFLDHEVEKHKQHKLEEEVSQLKAENARLQSVQHQQQHHYLPSGPPPTSQGWAGPAHPNQ